MAAVLCVACCRGGEFQARTLTPEHKNRPTNQPAKKHTAGQATQRARTFNAAVQRTRCAGLESVEHAERYKSTGLEIKRTRGGGGGISGRRGVLRLGVKSRSPTCSVTAEWHETTHTLP